MLANIIHWALFEVFLFAFTTGDNTDSPSSTVLSAADINPAASSVALEYVVSVADNTPLLIDKFVPTFTPPKTDALAVGSVYLFEFIALYTALLVGITVSVEEDVGADVDIVTPLSLITFPLAALVVVITFAAVHVVAPVTFLVIDGVTVTSWAVPPDGVTVNLLAPPAKV